MQSFEDMLSGASPEDIELMLEKIAVRKMLLASKAQNLASVSIHKIPLDSEATLMTASLSNNMLPFGVFSSQDGALVTVTGMDKDDCHKFLQDYLKLEYRRGLRASGLSRSIADSVINGEKIAFNFSIEDIKPFSAEIFYDATSRILSFKVGGRALISRAESFSAYLKEKSDDFFKSVYVTDVSFKTELYADGKVVDFDETEFSGDLSLRVAAASSASEVAVVVSEEIVGPAIKDTLEAEEADLSERKRTSSESTESEPQIGSIVDANFFVKTMVNPKTAGLSFAVSPLRPDTYLGRQQGAHITAYIVFVTAILETVDEQSISDIPDLLVAAAMQFVPSSQWESFQNTLQELIKDNPFFEKRERKQLTAGLRDTVQETTVKFIKKSVKIHYAVVLAHLIDDLSNQILMAINKSESTLYARAGRPKSRQELGQEGAKIRNAMKNLRKIVAGISMKAPASLIEQFSVFSMTDSDVAAGEDKVMPSRHNTRSRAPSSSKSSAGLSDNIASLIFDLFDFDYYEYTSSAILGKIESSVLEEMKDLEKDLKKFKKGSCWVTVFLNSIHLSICLFGFNIIASAFVLKSPS